jgi:ABC-type lipoprotein release transport system permease subunit
LLFEVQDMDPRVMVGAAVALTVVVLGAGALPAWRASSIEPMTALRHQ